MTYGTLVRKLRSMLRPYYGSLVRRPIKRLVPPLLQRLPFSSEVLGPPKAILSAKIWVERYNATTKGPPATYQAMDPAHPITRQPPKTIHAHVDEVFNERSLVFPESYVVSIPGGRAWGIDGAVVTPDDCLLDDLSPEYDFEREIKGKHTIFSQFKLARAQHEPGTVAVLATLSQTFYAHWMLDMLPRAHLLQRAGYPLDAFDKFFLIGPDLPHQRQTLAALGIPLTRIINCRTCPHIKADRLVVPSPVGGVFGAPRWTFDFLRRQFGPAPGTPPAGSPERIYISRARTRHRWVLNEAEITKYLQTLGFTVVTPETLSLDEQAGLYANARVIVTPLSSAMANLVYCQQNTRVIEFFNPRCIQTCTWALCNHLGLDYYYVVGQGHDPRAHPVGDHLSLDVELLAATLNLAGVGPASKAG